MLASKFISEYDEPALFRSVVSGNHQMILASADLPSILSQKHSLSRHLMVSKGKFTASAPNCLSDRETLVIQHVNFSWPPIQWICDEVSALLGTIIQANAYRTPKHAWGFSSHSDPYPIIIVQCDGGKVWKLLRPKVNSMSESHEITVRVEAGDLLYIPQGWFHMAKTEEKASLHVTFGSINMEN